VRTQEIEKEWIKEPETKGGTPHNTGHTSLLQGSSLCV